MNGNVSSSNQFQCTSSVSDDCHGLQLGSSEGTTIAVRGSITLSSGRYLPQSVNGNHLLSLPLSNGDMPSTLPGSTYTNLSSATPTLSSLLNTPSLHNQSANLTKCVNTSSSVQIPLRSNSHQSLQSPSVVKNKNIVAANPLLAGELKVLMQLPSNKLSCTILLTFSLQRNWQLRPHHYLRPLAPHWPSL